MFSYVLSKLWMVLVRTFRQVWRVASDQSELGLRVWTLGLFDASKDSKVQRGPCVGPQKKGRMKEMSAQKAPKLSHATAARARGLRGSAIRPPGREYLGAPSGQDFEGTCRELKEMLQGDTLLLEDRPEIFCKTSAY